MKPSGSGPVLQQIELDENAAKLRGQEFELLLAEMEYDMKTFKVWKKKVQDYEIRLLSLKDDWLMKRHSAAKSAMKLFLDTKASGVKTYPKVLGLGLNLISVGINFTFETRVRRVTIYRPTFRCSTQHGPRSLALVRELMVR